MKRVNRIPLNDFYYGRLVELWLPYSQRLLKDAKGKTNKPHKIEQNLETLGYDPVAIRVFVGSRRSWRSAVEYTCQCLATRGGIRMAKPREDPDIARTLRNAYSRVYGANARRLFESVF